MPEIRSDAKDNLSAEHSRECLRLFGLDIVLDVIYTFLNYTPFSGEGIRLEGNIAQLACSDTWIARMLICLTEQKRRGGHRQKLYADTYPFYVTAVTRQTIRNIVAHAGTFLNARGPNKLYLTRAQHNSDFVV